MALFSEKILISNRCISGLMPNLIKKSWTDSNIHIYCAFRPNSTTYFPFFLSGNNGIINKQTENCSWQLYTQETSYTFSTLFFRQRKYHRNLSKYHSIRWKNQKECFFQKNKTQYPILPNWANNRRQTKVKAQPYDDAPTRLQLVMKIFYWRIMFLYYSGAPW